jgi:hypothetical protein
LLDWLYFENTKVRAIIDSQIAISQVNIAEGLSCLQLSWLLHTLDLNKSV